MKYFKILLLLFAVTLNSCKKDDIKIDPDNLLIGSWYFADSDNEFMVYTRSASIPDNKQGYNFRGDGTLIVRDLDGWCATPPVSYANFDGTWKVLNDTLVSVERNYWGGTLSCKLDIESVTKNTLKIVVIY
jgi:hypothetical protein